MGLGILEIILVAGCMVTVIAIAVIVLVVVRLSKQKNCSDRDVDERVEREDVGERD